MTTTLPTPEAQNRAHRNDLEWIKVGRSEYMRSDGVTIRKHLSISGYWTISLPNGDRPCMVLGGEVLRNTPASGHSLTAAKRHAQEITTATPVYDFSVRRG